MKNAKIVKLQTPLKAMDFKVASSNMNDANVKLKSNMMLTNTKCTKTKSNIDNKKTTNAKRRNVKLTIKKKHVMWRKPIKLTELYVTLLTTFKSAIKEQEKSAKRKKLESSNTMR